MFGKFVKLGLFALLITSLSAQADTTYVSGIIDTNSVWDPTGNPYIVLDSVIVDSSVSLRVDSGVVVKFNASSWMDVYGTLNVIGTKNAPVLFTSNSNPPQAGDWSDLLFSSGSIGNLDYMRIEYANGIGNYGDSLIINHSIISYSGYSGIWNDGIAKIYNSIICYNDNLAYGVITNQGDITVKYNTIAYNGMMSGLYNGGSALISHNTIEYNDAFDEGGIYVYDAGMPVVIDSNSIRNNIGYGIWTEEKSIVIRDNIISGNTRSGIRVKSGPTVYSGATITGNTIVYNEQDGILLEDPDSTTVMHNTIAYNNWNGISCNNSGEISYNTIVYNDRAIFNTGNPVLLHNTIAYNGSGIYNGGDMVIDSSNIYDNDPYYVANHIFYDIDAADNWWGTTDTALIDSFIYDYRDNPDYGEVSYMPILLSPDTLAPTPPPGGLRVSQSKGSNIAIEWNPLSLADLKGYKVYYDKNSGYPYTGTGANEGNSPIDVGNITAFQLTGLDSGYTYYLTVTAYDNYGNESWYSREATISISSGITETHQPYPVKKPALSVYPNPAVSSPKISYLLPEGECASIKIYDISGRLVEVLADKKEVKGKGEIIWRNRNIPAGTYFVILKGERFKITRKVILLK